VSRPEPPSTLVEWREAREKGWRPITVPGRARSTALYVPGFDVPRTLPVPNMPREGHRAPDEWREGREGRESNLADLVADQLGLGPVDRIRPTEPYVELPSSVRRTLNAVKFKTQLGNDPGGWNITHVPESRKDIPQRAYRRYRNMAGGDRDTLKVARLSTWFCALLAETDIEPWHLVTRADSKLKVPLRDGQGQPYEWGIGWVNELFARRRVSYTEVGERHYPRAYFNEALVMHPKVGQAERIRLDDVTRRQYAEPLVDMGQMWTRPKLWPEFDVHTRHDTSEPVKAPSASAAPLACTFHWPNGDHRPSPIHRISLHRVPSVPWTDPQRNDSPWGPPPKADEGWNGFRQPVCLGHFGEHFDAIDRSWKNIVLRADDGSIPLVEKKSAEELLAAPDEYREWTPDDPDDLADHLETDPLDPAQLAARKPPMRNVRIAPPEDSPEFDTAELIQVAADLGIWDILDEEGRMMLAFHIDGLTRKDVAKMLHMPERTLYNRTKAGTLRQMISQKSSGKLPI
jgi:hypothetical protein